MYTTLKFEIKIHLFNGRLASIEAFGIITKEEDAPIREETFISLINLSSILRPIYQRLVKEGYKNIDGVLMKDIKKK